MPVKIKKAKKSNESLSRKMDDIDSIDFDNHDYLIERSSIYYVPGSMIDTTVCIRHIDRPSFKECMCEECWNFVPEQPKKRKRRKRAI